MASLDQLLVGQQARVLSIAGNDSLTQRLYEMGLLEGDLVELLSVAPLGDPLEFRLGDSRLSLRRREAARVEVTLVP